MATRVIGGQTVLVRPVQAKTRTAAQPKMEPKGPTPRDEILYDPTRKRRRVAAPVKKPVKKDSKAQKREAAVDTLWTLATKLGIQNPRELMAMINATPQLKGLFPGGRVPGAQAPLTPAVAQRIQNFASFNKDLGKQQTPPGGSAYEEQKKQMGFQGPPAGQVVQPIPKTSRRQKIAKMILGGK